MCNPTAPIRADLTTEALQAAIAAMRHAQGLITEGKIHDAQRELGDAAAAGQDVIELLAGAQAAFPTDQHAELYATPDAAFDAIIVQAELASRCMARGFGAYAQRALGRIFQIAGGACQAAPVAESGIETAPVVEGSAYSYGPTGDM